MDHPGDESPVAALHARAVRQQRRDPADGRPTELWFVPVANPDGYDYTFTEGNRLWRKNLRDNDGDGEITGFDGVDLNRNFPYRWGYDNEGSSPVPTSETYRGPAPASEPETRALDGLMRRIGFAFLVNYHSAAELLLYGIGWQVATPTPDDLLYETLAGDDANPAVPGYDPDIAAELYTTNGETTEHAHNRYGTLAFTPEMATCETASAVDPDDAYEPEDCESIFIFPDSEALVQAEFEKNLPFALAVAQSAPDPDDPVSVVGRTAPDFAVDSFAISYGDPQPVAVTARRDLRNLAMNYSINGGRDLRVPVREWRGGERYGDEADVYYAEYPRRRPRSRAGRQRRRSGSPAAGPARATGPASPSPTSWPRTPGSRCWCSPTRTTRASTRRPTPTGTEPKYAARTSRRSRPPATTPRSGMCPPGRAAPPRRPRGTSRPCVWYLGDNRLTQDPEDAETEISATSTRRPRWPSGSSTSPVGARLPQRAGQGAARRRDRGLLRLPRQHDRRHLLRPGRCARARSAWSPLDLFSDCLLLADDFFQYYLGAYTRSTAPNPTELHRRR